MPTGFSAQVLNRNVCVNSVDVHGPRPRTSMDEVPAASEIRRTAHAQREYIGSLHDRLSNWII